MRWDYANRLQATGQQVVNSGTPETTYYTYDAAGERVRKVTEHDAPAGTGTRSHTLHPRTLHTTRLQHQVVQKGDASPMLEWHHRPGSRGESSEAIGVPRRLEDRPYVEKACRAPRS